MLEASIEAIRDAGLGAGDIDGICGSTVAAQYVQAALGIPEVRWFANPQSVIGNQMVAAVSAVVAGLCDTALVYHNAYRLPWASRSAAADPMRQRATLGGGDARNWWGTGHNEVGARSMFGAVAYAAWADRYLRDYGYTREHLGRIAINSRTNAAANDNAVYRTAPFLDNLILLFFRKFVGQWELVLPLERLACVYDTYSVSQFSFLPLFWRHSRIYCAARHTMNWE